MKRSGSIVLLIGAALLAGCSPSGPAARPWEETGGPYARNIRAILPDGKAAGTVYACLGNGEIGVSTSGGRTWLRASAIPGNPEIRQMVQDPDNPDRLLAATDAGAFVSPDRAKSWTPLDVGPRGTGIHVLAIDPWSTTTAYAGTEGRGIYKSTDGGRTWQESNASGDLLLSGAEVFDLAIDLSKPDLVFAAVAPYGIVSSTNGGAGWKGLTPGFSATSSRTTHLLIRKDGHGTLLYGTSSGSIRKTTDGGLSWISSRVSEDFDGILSLCAIPGNPDLVFAGTERGLIASPDFGASWKAAGGDLPRVGTRVTTASGGGHAAMFAFGAGIGLRSSDDNGATWRGADLKLAGSTIHILESDPSGGHLYAATGNVCLSYAAGPAGAWLDAGPGITGGPVRSVSADPVIAGLVYATTAAGVFLSTDKGTSWRPAPRSLQVTPFLYQAHPTIKTRILMAGEQGIFISTDNGRSWNQTKPLGARWTVRAFTFSPSNAGTIIGATSNSSVIISRDGGFTWEQSRYGIPGDGVELVALDNADPDTYYAYTPDGDCFRSLNKGLEWNRYSPPWKPGESVMLSRDMQTPSSIVALVDNRHVYYSPSGGGTWFRLYDANLHASAVSLCWNASSMTLYAGARDRGVFRLHLGGKIREITGE